MPQFHLISWCGNFVERHSFHKLCRNCSKLCGNCDFPQNFLTRKLGEITVFYADPFLRYVNQFRGDFLIFKCNSDKVFFTFPEISFQNLKVKIKLSVFFLEFFSFHNNKSQGKRVQHAISTSYNM